MKKLFIFAICSLIVLSFIAGCTNKPKDMNVCGDGSCTLTEDCNTCPQDCACGSGEYCDDFGVCREERICGDEVCTEEERTSGTCCEDCGCEESEVCNKVTQECQEKIEVSEETINKVVEDYLSENNIVGKIKKIVDTYHKDQTIKEVTIDCGSEDLPYPCEIILFINEQGEIIEEMITT